MKEFTVEHMRKYLVEHELNHFIIHQDGSGGIESHGGDRELVWNNIDDMYDVLYEHMVDKSRMYTTKERLIASLSREDVK